MKINKIVRLSYLLSLGFVFFLFVDGLAQQDRNFSIEWADPQEIILENNRKLYVPTFSNQTMVQGTFYFQHREEVPAKTNATFQFLSYQSTPARPQEIDFLTKEHIIIPDSVQWEAMLSNGGAKRYLTVSVVPFVRENNQIMRVTSFAIRQLKTSYVQNYATKSSSESVLRTGSGTWYKIAVKHDGLHKITRQFLTDMGINTTNLNPDHIHIYGNGDGMIPEQNNLPRTDDLAKNAILIVGGDDGSFDKDDYIVFYARGPHRWDLESGTERFVNVRHLYSDQSCYFININPGEPPLRVQNQAPSTAMPTHNITSYSYRMVHEKDWINVAKSGQRWYGEQFDVELSQTFPLFVPHPIPNTPARIFIALAASNDGSEATSSFQFYLNGTAHSSATLSSHPEYYVRTERQLTFLHSGSPLYLRVDYNRPIPSLIAYLDKIELNARCQLIFSGAQFSFRDIESLGSGNVGKFTLQNFPQKGFVWDITNRHEAKRIVGALSGTSFSFTMPLDTLREYVASDGENFLEPSFVGRVNHQNLHGLAQVDYLIISHPNFLSQAHRLANLHRQHKGLSVHVVNLFDIYNEFSSGVPDAGAIRCFVKMFYDRSTSSADQIKYVCLFGDGTYDPKNRVSGNASSSFIPTYQLLGVPNAEDPQRNIVTDDYFAILDDNEGMSAGVLPDVGLGRIIVSTTQMAKEQVDKIEHYMLGKSSYFTQNNINCIDGVSSSSMGNWRTRIGNIADFEDYFMMGDQEPAYTYLKTNHPEVNVEKLYADIYPAVVELAGTRFPELNQAVLEHFNYGSLVLNYVGHGGPRRLSAARVLTIPMIESLRNSDRLPLFVSATCEFTVFDDPSYLSAGERLFLNTYGGAIALMTTTRTVSYSINSQVNAAFFRTAFKRKITGEPQTFGEILMNTKIETTSPSTDKMAFNLIGDPALQLALPTYKIVIDSINGTSPNMQTDTIRALSKVHIKAHLEDHQGGILSNFQGTAVSTLYDKPRQMKTRGQRPGSTIFHSNVNDYEIQQNVVFRGQSTVKNGYFAFEFIVPKDIDYTYGNGKFSLYADDKTRDAIGIEQNFLLGGINPNGLNDNIPPDIKLYINHESFVNGGISDESPFLIAKLADENGINTAGNSIGHDILAFLDNDITNPIRLNNYFVYDTDSYQKGSIRYQLHGLAPGKHSLTLKAWDINNNVAQQTIEFIVQEKAELSLAHVLNYPNPFTTSTDFYFEHNQCCTELETQIQIFTVSGRLVKTINRLLYTPSYRSEGIHWDGRDEFGDPLARGVYVYRVKVKTPEGKTAEKIEKLVLL